MPKPIELRQRNREYDARRRQEQPWRAWYNTRRWRALREAQLDIEQALEKQLLTADDRANGVVIEFNLEGLLRGDSAARSNFYQSALTNGWMTINEVRALENMPPVDGGDVPRMQSQNIPITESGQLTSVTEE